MTKKKGSKSSAVLLGLLVILIGMVGFLFLQPDHTDYDGYNRVVRTIDPIGNICKTRYDANNNKVEYTCFGPVGGPSPTDASGTGNVLLSRTLWLYDPIDPQPGRGIANVG